MVPDRPALHQGPRVGPRRRRRGDRRASPQYAADQLGDIVFVELPDVGRALEQFATFGVVESVKAVSDLFAPVARRGRSRPTTRSAGKPGARQQRPVRRRAGCSASRLADAGAARRPARRGRLRRAHRGGLTTRCRTVRTPPTTARGCSRRSASTVGRRAVRGHPRRAPRVAARPARARARARARRPAAGPGRPQPDRPRVVPGRRRLPPLDARRPSTSCCSAASGTRPTRRTSPRSARARSRASTSTSRCSPSWSTSTSCRPRTTTAPPRPPRPR